MGMKEAYQNKADSQLYEWQAWIEQYKTGAPRPVDPVRYRLLVERLEEGYRVARESLDELHDAQDGGWEFSKQAVERAMIDLKRLLDESGAAQNAKYLTLRTSRSYAYEPFYRRG